MFTKSVKGRLSPLVVACMAAAMAASGQTNAGALQKAAVLARQHRFKEAMAEMKGVAPPVETPQRIAYFRLRAAVASGMGDASGAAVAMEEGLRLAPGDSNLRLATAAAQAALGDVSEKRGRSLQAVRAFQRAVKLAPEVEDFRLALAVELLQHQTFAPAIATLEEGTKQFPESPRIRAALGLAYFFVDRDADAVRTLLSASGYAPALHYLAEIELHRSAEPDPAAVRLLCGDKEFETVCAGLELRQAMDAGDDSRREQIIQSLKEAATSAPTDTLARCELGKAFEWASQWIEARTELEACERLDPNSAETHYRLSRVYRQLGQKELAAKEANLRALAEKRQGAANERRYSHLTQFLYTMRK